MIYLPPVFFFLFSLMFFGVWFLERTRPHLGLFGCAFLLVSLGTLVQVTFVPANIGQNAVLSAALYVAGVLFFSQGVLIRSGRQLPFWFHALFMITIVGGTFYYFYIERNLFYRIYIINLGVGAIFLATALQARFLLRGTSGDKLLFWLIVGLGLHFFPRTIMTAERMTMSSVIDFSAGSFWLVLQFTISVIGVVTGIGLLAVTFMDMIAELRKERDTDSLTGLANRRLFSQHVETMMGRGRSLGKPMCFAMIDVDHFKLYNDIYGHAAGDEALKHVAGTISATLRRSEDMAARIGGEEFALFFYDCTTEQARQFLEKLRTQIAALKIEHEGSLVSGVLTISVGVAELENNEDFESLYRRADVSLYSSKATGRDQVTFA